MTDFLLTIAAGGFLLFSGWAVFFATCERVAQPEGRRDYIAAVALAFCLVANPVGLICSVVLGLPVVWLLRGY